MREPDYNAPERLRFEGEGYVLDPDPGNRQRGVPVVREATYRSLARELERLRRTDKDPTAVFKSTTGPRFTPERHD